MDAREMTTGEAEAWRAGWEAARDAAAHELRQRAADPACLEPYGLALAANVVEAMEPPAMPKAQPSMAPFFITETLFRGTHMGYSFTDTCGAMLRVRENKGFATWAEARAAGWDVRACKVRVMPAEPPR